ncbi:MAG: electron transfer flavoprotein beta subunit [Clostridia bacterium]|jgi:electron transfer flavoprotein beta subunit|nr:electron transfer flavoprotein beta subunit [Clostridia bacterium]MDN5323538.1 electron transfer flavoprotein beta subunit [Clostridia bacterium]
MKKVVACYKWVIDEADIRVEEKDHSLNFERAKYKISEYDRNAIEAGALLNEEKGCEFLAVTCGPNVEASLKDVLSRGPASISYVNEEWLADVDSSVTSKILAGIIKKIGNVDLVICGEGSSDDYSQQVGPRLAALLGYASVTFVNKLDITEEGIKVERKLEDGVEVLEVKGPAVVTVLPDINKPRIPSLKQILAAKKKPTEKISLKEIGFDINASQPKLKTLSISGTVMERKNMQINTDGLSIKDAALKLVKQLNADGSLA